MPITSTPYGELPDGSPVQRFTLANEAGMSADIMTYGGIVLSINVPDRDGNITDVALGKPDLAAYLAGHPHFGAISGRVAGRLTGGRFTLDGESYQLEINDGPNHLHGGSSSFDKMNWQPEIVMEDGQEKLRLRHHDPEGANGYPGNVDCTVDYVVTPDNELRIDYRITTDRATPMVVTNHSYFNLKGEGEGLILDHELQIFADEVAILDREMTLLGKKRSVDGTADDFREPALIGDRVAELHEQHGSGYFLPGGRTAEPRLVARVREPSSGRVLETLTTEPYLQFYTSSQMDEGEGGKRVPYGKHCAFCLEAHEYSDAVNAPHLGDGVLRPGEDFRSTTIYRFRTD